MPDCASFSSFVPQCLDQPRQSVAAEISDNLVLTTTNQDFQLEEILLKQGDG